jgi:hypothetical protein
MTRADPWNESTRLEDALEADLLRQLERARLWSSAESFCVESCRVDCRCPLAGALQSKDHCPLWAYMRMMPLSA